MYIEKEPAKAVENAKAKKALEKEPPPESKAKKDLKGLPYQDQVKAQSPRAPEAARTPEAVKAKGDPVGELKRIFRDMDLPEKLVPANVLDFSFDAKTGALVIQLREAFSKSFDAENTVSFDRTISGTLKRGSLAGISGISRGSAAIVEMSRARAGVVAIRGKLGPFSKTMEFKDEQLPGLP